MRLNCFLNALVWRQPQPLFKSSTVNTQRQQTGTRLRRLTAWSLVLWLGGIGCLAGCAGMSNMSADVGRDSATASALVPRAAAPHACCQRRRNDVASGALTGTPQTTEASCCPLAGQTIAATRKVRASNAPGVHSAATSTRFSLRLAATTCDAPPQLARARLDQSTTYLLGCAFLI